MSSANQVGYAGWAGTATRAGAEWIGKHRAQSRVLLTLRRMFYSARHRRY